MTAAAVTGMKDPGDDVGGIQSLRMWRKPKTGPDHSKCERPTMSKTLG